MHRYLKKLVDQGWIGSRWNIVGWQLGKHKLRYIKNPANYRKARFGIKKQIIKLTAFLPKNFSLKYRIRFLRSDLNEKEIKCPVIGCGGWRKLGTTSSGKKHLFRASCQRQDNNHKKFYGILSNADSYRRRHYNLKNYNILSKDYIEKNFLDENNFIKIEEFKNFIGCSYTAVLTICRVHDVNFTKRSGSSHIETKIINFLNLIVSNLTIITNSKQIIIPKELDIYLPDQKVAVEYNGLTFHSHGTSDWSGANNPTPIPNRQLDKTKSCQEKDIDLIHVFEDEYANNQEAVELVIKRKLGLEPWPIYTQDIIHWNLNNGLLPEQLRRDYIIIKVVPPRPNYFRDGHPFRVSQWTPFKTDVKLYNAGYRKYYDCGQLTLRRNND